MSKRLMSGGSQGEPVRAGSLPYFYPEVKAVELITKNVYGVRLLPAFQRDESGLPVSDVSFIPYRDAANIDPSNGKPIFTDWYYSLKGYKFIGTEGRSFLSPLISERTDRRGVDPLFDCFHLARNSKDSRPDWHSLTEKAEGDKNATLEKYRVFCAMNAFMEADRQIVNRLVIVTKAGLDDLKDQLNILCSRADEPNDPDWPDFMLGDVTSPYHGLWAVVQKGKFNTAGMEASLFSFSRQRDRLVNHTRYPVDPNADWGATYLANRYDISDLEKVTRVATAEEILQFIVTDGFLPIDLVREACSAHWDIPEVKGRRMSAPKAFSEAPETGGGAFRQPPARTMAPAAPAAAAPAVAPTTSSRQFWVLDLDGNVMDRPVPEAVLRKMAQTRPEMTVQLVGESEWKPAAVFGIVSTPPVAPTPPTPPAPPVKPPAPPAAPVRPPGAPPAPPATRPPAAPSAAPKPPGAPPAPPAATRPPAAPKPPGAPPVAPKPPAAPMMPAAAPIPQQPPAAAAQPEPSPEPQQQAPAEPPAAPAAPAAGALAPEEFAEMQALEKEWMASTETGQPMDGDKIQRFFDLTERFSATAGQ